jgi:predicted nucleic acid-binding protein
MESTEPGLRKQSPRRREYIQELVELAPVHPVTLQTPYLVGQIEGQEAEKGNVLPFNDLLIAAVGIRTGLCRPDRESPSF